MEILNNSLLIRMKNSDLQAKMSLIHEREILTFFRHFI